MKTTLTFKPLDFVRPKSNPEMVGIITEISNTQDIYYQASIEWIGPYKNLKNAWWSADEFTVIDNLPRLLTRELAHPFGSGSKDSEGIY